MSASADALHVEAHIHAISPPKGHPGNRCDFGHSPRPRQDDIKTAFTHRFMF